MQPTIIKTEPPKAVWGLSEASREVVLAYAKNNMSAKATATQLFRHYNGIMHHLTTVKKKTGLDPRQFFDLCKLVSVIDGPKVLDVLRCENCVHAEEAYINSRGLKICPASGMIFSDEDYCSRAIRRNNARAD